MFVAGSHNPCAGKSVLFHKPKASPCRTIGIQILILCAPGLHYNTCRHHMPPLNIVALTHTARGGAIQTSTIFGLFGHRSMGHGKVCPPGPVKTAVHACCCPKVALFACRQWIACASNVESLDSAAVYVCTAGALCRLLIPGRSNRAIKGLAVGYRCAVDRT